MKTVKDVEHFLKDKKIHFEAIYLYGSQAYGTATDKSDWDFLVVSESDKQIDSITFESKKTFLEKMNIHDVRTLECIYSSEQFKIETAPFKEYISEWSLDINLLRIGISSTASNSWVKCKKKIEVECKTYIGLKSLFHSLRILDFGIQIATHGKIIDFASSNKYWADIKFQTSWTDLKIKYQPIYNSLKTEFRNKTNAIK